MQLGELAWLFHPSELFSVYGLAIRHAPAAVHELLARHATDPAHGDRPRRDLQQRC